MPRPLPNHRPFRYATFANRLSGIGGIAGIGGGIGGIAGGIGGIGGGPGGISGGIAGGLGGISGGINGSGICGQPPPIPLDTAPHSNAADISDMLLLARLSKPLLAVAAGGADTVLFLDNRPFGGQPTAVTGLPAGSNPRRLAVSGDGGTVVVSNFLSDSLTVIDVSGDVPQVVRHVDLGGPSPDAARRGEVLFHSNRLTANGRFTCAWCHPGGGSDNLTWELPGDPAKSLRRTKPLFGVRDTAPYGWRGDSPTLADRIRKTLTTLHRHTPSDAEVSDLVAYLESLDPPEPPAVKPEDRPAMERGRTLFADQAQCSRCHRGDALQDGHQHDVGTGGTFDAPSLRGVGHRTPLLHDGRALNVADLFRRHNVEQKHGAAHTLTSAEMTDLIAFLSSM